MNERLVLVIGGCGLLAALSGGGYLLGNYLATHLPDSISGRSKAINELKYRSAPAIPVRTVAWFKDHRAEMISKYAGCRNDPGMGSLDPECQNVMAAKQSADIDDVLRSKP